jgi:hypothetical protein
MIIPTVVFDFLLMVVYLVITFIGTRLFRGRHEWQSRPLWKATGGPTTSFVVAGLWMLVLLDDLRVVGFADSVEQRVFALVFLVLGDVVLIAFYLQSGVRQRREPEETGLAKAANQGPPSADS